MFHTPAHKQADPAKRPAQIINVKAAPAAAPAAAEAACAARRNADHDVRSERSQARADAAEATDDMARRAKAERFWATLEKFASGQLG